jgi:hypothetical protein
MDAVRRMTERLRELRLELRALDDRREAIRKEMVEIQGAAKVLHRFDPFAIIDEQTPSLYAHLDLRSKSIAEACTLILRETDEPATARELTNVLVREGRWPPNKPSSLISVISTLKRHPELFAKHGNEWTLTMSPTEFVNNGAKASRRRKA